MVMLMMLVMVFLLGLAFGSTSINLAGLFDSSNLSYLIVYKLRLPRVVAAGLSGVALATAGLLLQKANDNDLASPTVMGTNAGAGFFVMLVLCYLPKSFYLLPVAAFIGALISVALVLLITRKSTRHLTSGNIVLGGVAISSLFNGGIAFLSQVYPDAVGSYVYFSTGGFTGIKTSELVVPGIIILIGVIWTFKIARPMSTLCLGDDLASNLAVNVKKTRTCCILLASALTACSVSYAGLLGFVGLLVPHIAQRLIGNKPRELVMSNMILGAILVILADLVGRFFFAPSEISAGIILSFIGAPFFIYLLLRKRRIYAGS